MTTKINIALIGDYNPQVTAHQAIPKAIQIAAEATGNQVGHHWIDTQELTGDVAHKLTHYSGIWAVPASPYQNMSGAIEAIRYARESGTPFFGSCGGFQHAVLEFARNVLGHAGADNSEVNPDTDFPLVSALVCALVEESDEISLLEHSRAATIYGEKKITEKYHCSYGFNPLYQYLFDNSELRITGFDQNGDPRAFELASHPFFIATAYQPERSALRGKGHPLITEFVRQAADSR